MVKRFTCTFFLSKTIPVIVNTFHDYQLCFQEVEGTAGYAEKFLEAGIDGLHLLEMSSAEMTGE